jgi:hypothetical protein
LSGNVDFRRELLNLIARFNIRGNKNRVDILGSFDQPKFKIYFGKCYWEYCQKILTGGPKILQDLVK